MTAPRGAAPGQKRQQVSGGRWPVSERSVLGTVLGIPPVAAVGVALGFTALGVLIDILRLGTLGTIFKICYFTGCVLAVAWVRRRNLFGPMVQPPLLIAVVVPAVVLLVGSPGPGAGITEKLLVIGAPLINSFPTMAVTTGVVVVLGVARILLQRDSGGPAGRSAGARTSGGSARGDRPGAGRTSRGARTTGSRRTGGSPRDPSTRGGTPSREPTTRTRGGTPRGTGGASRGGGTPRGAGAPSRGGVPGGTGGVPPRGGGSGGGRRVGGSNGRGTGDAGTTRDPGRSTDRGYRAGGYGAGDAGDRTSERRGSDAAPGAGRRSASPRRY